MTCPPLGIAVDDDPPETKITKHPPNKAGKRKVKFQFTSSDPGATFECKLDKKDFQSCDSPYKKKVKLGKHKFQVRAISADGRADPTPATDKFKVVG